VGVYVCKQTGLIIYACYVFHCLPHDKRLAQIHHAAVHFVARPQKNPAATFPAGLQPKFHTSQQKMHSTCLSTTKRFLHLQHKADLS